jgi:hypothetical protein
VASKNPRVQFAIELEATGGFYVMAIVMLRINNERIKLRKYLPKGSVLTDPSTISRNPAAYLTDFAMKQAQYWTNIGQAEPASHKNFDRRIVLQVPINYSWSSAKLQKPLKID